MTVPAAELEKARDALREAADELTTAVVHDIERDDGTRDSAVTPAPLELIARELTGSGRDGTFAPKSRPPLWIDAFSLLEEIDARTGAGSADRCEVLAGWAYACSSATTAEVLDTAVEVERWRGIARELLDPSPRFQLRGQACPSCAAVKVWHRLDRDNGEAYARPALAVDAERGVCTCSACGETWCYERWPHLTAVLEQQRAEVLSVEPHDPAAHVEVHPELVQCDGRVRDLDAPKYRTRRCPALLDVDGGCRNAERHEPT